jgi:hypothetical protein
MNMRRCCGGITPAAFAVVAVAVIYAFLCAGEGHAETASCDSISGIWNAVAATEMGITESEGLAQELASRADKVAGEYRACEAERSCANSKRYIELGEQTRATATQRRKVDALVVSLKERKIEIEAQMEALLKALPHLKSCIPQQSAKPGP